MQTETQADSHLVFWRKHNGALFVFSTLLGIAACASDGTRSAADAQLANLSDATSIDAGFDDAASAPGSDVAQDAEHDAEHDAEVADVDRGDGAHAADAAGADTDAPRQPSLELIPGEAPIALPEGATYYPDIAYGEHEQNAFDVLLPSADTPTPLLVYIHGGGFTGGDKAALFRSADEETVEWLSEGIAVATLNYRTLVPGDTDGVLKSLGDSRYALQFLRYHAEALNIDPDRVALFGGSAGAGTSLWLAANDEMADPDAEDPVRRMSTRVRAAGLTGTQGTYDLVRWETDVFAEFGITLDLIARVGPEMLDTMAAFYGLGPDPGDVIAALETPDIVAYRAQVDMLALLDDSDPPIWIRSAGPAAAPDDIGTLYHHPNHGRVIRDYALAAGVTVYADLPTIGVVDDDVPALYDFLADAVR